jgi:hypothetical protein
MLLTTTAITTLTDLRTFDKKNKKKNIYIYTYLFKGEEPPLFFWSGWPRHMEGNQFCAAAEETFWMLLMTAN